MPARSPPVLGGLLARSACVTEIPSVRAIDPEADGERFRRADEPIPGRLIVVLDQQPGVRAVAASDLGRRAGDYQLEVGRPFRRAMPGFAATRARPTRRSTQRDLARPETRRPMAPGRW